MCRRSRVCFLVVLNLNVLYVSSVLIFVTFGTYNTYRLLIYKIHNEEPNLFQYLSETRVDIHISTNVRISIRYEAL